METGNSWFSSKSCKTLSSACFQNRTVFWHSSHRSVEHLRGFGQLGSAQFILCLWTFTWAPSQPPAFPFSLGLFGYPGLESSLDTLDQDFTQRGWNTWNALTGAERNQNAETSNTKMSNEWHQNLTEAKPKDTHRASRQMGTTEETRMEQWRDDKTVARKEQCKIIWIKFAAENQVWCQERNLRNMAGLTAVQLLGLDKRESPSVRRRRSEA